MRSFSPAASDIISNDYLNYHTNVKDLAWPTAVPPREGQCEAVRAGLDGAP
ncbi:MAG TPA: hypothetical protein P5555_11965 [Candidatus Paceibacterota bacterium]|nr:hypothetical protein [Verrucomicrobiota bacterium]HOX03120.1 hypothetical protein [Verrucomicrobiota bacterium]HRZ45896.1 hypothetical protein [Candidatus Paceibacterota bacterium]HRZ94899.1 hypothetical protein [Candidatus Paceibacterota bacterium]